MDSKERIARALALSTDTKVFEMGNGVAEMIPEVFRKCFPGRKAVIIADVHTYPVLGEKVYNLFSQAGLAVDKYIIAKESFHADWKYV